MGVRVGDGPKVYNDAWVVRTHTCCKKAFVRHVVCNPEKIDNDIDVPLK